MTVNTGIKKILIFSLSNIGDIVLTLPVIDIVLRDFPGAKVSVAVGPKGKELLEGNPVFDRIIIFDKHQPLPRMIKWFCDLRKEHFDLVVDLRNTAIPLFLGARRITPLFLQRFAHQHMSRQHLNRLFSVHPFLNQFAPRLALSISQSHKDSIRNHLGFDSNAGQRLIVVAPGAADQAKRWPAIKFAQAVNSLAQKHPARVVLVGDLNDRPVALEVSRNCSVPHIDLSGKLNLRELAALLEQADLVITNDSAPAHLASYLQRPVVTIFGPTDPQKYGPWSPRSHVIQKKNFCAACQNEKSPGPHQCLDILDPEDVVRSIDLAWGQGLWDGDVIRDCPSPAGIRNILVIRTDRIGDVVLTTPALRALRRAFPQARISLLVSPATKDLVIGNPDLDEVLVDDRRGAHRGLLGFFRLVRSLRARRFDLAIIFHTKKRTNWMSFFSGIPRRLGYRDSKAGFLLTQKIPDNRHLGIMHESQYCLEVLRPLGIQDASRNFVVSVQPENEKWAEDFFRQAKMSPQKTIIAVHPGASCPTKKWPVKFFIETIREIVKKYPCEIILIGSRDIQAEARQIREGVPTAVWDLAGKTSVGQLTSILKRCRLLVSNDSGPVHIASALGIGVVSIFTRNQPGINPERWAPLGAKSRSVAPEVDQRASFAKGEVLDSSLLEKVKPAEVLAVVDEVYKLC